MICSKILIAMCVLFYFSIEIEFTSGLISSHGTSSDREDCSLEDNEHITAINAYYGDGFMAIKGFGVLTTHKQCSLGEMTDNVKYMYGHHLLYVAGGCMQSGYLKSVTLNFDYNCTESLDLL